MSISDRYVNEEYSQRIKTNSFYQEQTFGERLDSSYLTPTYMSQHEPTRYSFGDEEY